MKTFLQRLFRLCGRILITGGYLQFLLIASVGAVADPDLKNESAATTAVQQREVKGRVIDDETNRPMPGVNILVKGTTEGTVTDLDGKYSIMVASPDAVLVFSMIGYEKQEVSVGNQTSINITLALDVRALDEVVVIGYGTQLKRDLTGAVANLQSEDINKELAASVDQMIQGKIPGVNVVTSSGAPGGGLAVNIRGSSSLRASSGPLYVIDGMPIWNANAVGNNAPQGQFVGQRASRNPLSSINPSDIESIDVLKDASATAIYGARGANGVILITTKQGKTGKLLVEYDGYAGLQNVQRKLDLLTADEYMTEMNEILDAGGADESERVTGIEDGGTDWQDVIYKDNALVQNHNLSFSGASDATSYRMSLNYFDQEGIIISSNFRRYGARLNLTHNIEDKFRFGMNLTSGFTEDDYVAVGQDVNIRAGVVNAANSYDPTIAVYKEDGTYNNSTFMELDHPLAIANGKNSFKNEHRTLGTFFAEYFILPELSAKINVGTDLKNERRDFYLDQNTIEGKGKGGQATVYNGSLWNYLAEGTLHYNKEIGVHRLDAVAGITTQRFISSSTSSSGSGFPSDVIMTNNLGLGNPENAIIGSGKSQSTLLSYLARVNYSINDRYLLTGSFRADGSSRFGENNKFGYFPSGALGWKIYREDFFSPLSNTISSLKLRVSWGLTGNQEIGNYRSLSTFTSGGRDAIPFDDTYMITMVPTRMANPDLKWETTEQTNVGLDYGFFQNRVNGSVDYFIKTTRDMLLSLPVPSSTGFSNQLQNVGSIKNSGIELGLEAYILTGLFKWRLNGSLASIRNEVLDLGGIPEIITGNATFSDNMGLIREGEPIYSFYGYEVVGIWQEDDDYGSTIDNVHPGDFKFRDVNDDGTVNADDRVILGNSIPDLTWSLANTFSFKNFDLYVFIDGVSGISMFNSKQAETYYPNNFRRNRLAEPILERWTPENPSNVYPSHIYPFSQGSKMVNSYTVEDASYLRLNTLRLSYTLVPLTSAVDAITVYVTGQNLFTITDYTGISPVVNTQGNANFRIDWNQYPIARTLMLGVKLSL